MHTFCVIGQNIVTAQLGYLVGRFIVKLKLVIHTSFHIICANIVFLHHYDSVYMLNIVTIMYSYTYCKAHIFMYLCSKSKIYILSFSALTPPVVTFSISNLKDNVYISFWSIRLMCFQLESAVLAV